MDGLFCERIFGPANDWECHCGKYRRVRNKGIVCERCGVEYTDAKVRRHRMGFIVLASPVTHVWYVKGRPSKIALVLDLSLKELEQIVYFNSYIVTDPGTNNNLEYKQIISESDWLALDYNSEMTSTNVSIAIGAEGIKDLLSRVNLQDEADSLRELLPLAKSIFFRDKII